MPTRRQAALLVDFGSTLYRLDRRALLGSCVGSDADLEHLLRLWSDCRTASRVDRPNSRGRNTSAQLHREYWLRALSPLDSHRPGLVDALYQKEQSPDYWRVDQEVANIIGRCRSAGWKAGLISNITWDPRPLLAADSVTIDGWFLSYELGLEKPDVRIFRTAIDTLAANPDQSLMIGDDPTSDGAAISAGLSVLLLAPNREAGSVLPSLIACLR